MAVTYDELDDEDKEQYEELFTEEDWTLPDKIEGEKFKTVIYNEDPIVFSTTVDDFKSYDEKLKFYINTHVNDLLVNRIRSLLPYTEDNIIEFKDEIIKFVKSQEEYDAVISSDEELVCFIRKNIEFIPEEAEKFISLQKDVWRTDA